MIECCCAREFAAHLMHADAYSDFKRVLNIGKHPAFIGRNTMMRNADNGGAMSYCHDGNIIAVSLMNPHLGILLVLNVIPPHRGHGMGSAIMRYLMPNFVRVLEGRVPWFVRIGYAPIGGLHVGRRLNTQIMVRSALIDLVGKLEQAWMDDGTESIEEIHDREYHEGRDA